MENKTEYIGIFIFGIAVLSNIIISLSKTQLRLLRYDRLLPFLFGILYGVFAYMVYLEHKPTTMVFIAIMGIAALWRVLKPSEPTDEKLSDPKNYKGGFFYYNKQDKRLFNGSSINFANPIEIGLLILILIGFASLAFIKK